MEIGEGPSLEVALIQFAIAIIAVNVYIASGCIGEDEAEAGKELWENENPNRSITFRSLCILCDVIRHQDETRSLFSIGYP
ncbi:hypothetical protein OUZ56_008253 [Daphnia magna]|uniref:Uncharacterized protein n=1 Tax=Daphnia magna TaxID=35525 RepID=A0ABR0ACF9_9CRUS|nr:hypothetical protein OUZ56_008253 [Daphnia magna]